MKAFLCSLGLLAVMALSCVQAATNSQPTGFRLTVELRDGSRVIGASRDKHFEFYSGGLGEIKLPLEKIRFVESLAKTNLFKLTTASGDSLTVALAMENIRLETTYGEVKLPVGMIKSLRVTSGKVGRPLDGLIGLWSGEENAEDAIGGNRGTLRNVGFTAGVVGRAFSFAPDNFPYGTYTGVQIPDRPAFILTQALTIEGWVRPRGNGYIILCRGDHRPGTDPYTLSMQANHDLRFAICGSGGDSDMAYIDANIPYCEWTHVAAVWDGSAGTMSLYTNGVLAVQTATRVRPIGELIPEMSPGLGIGNLNDGGNNFPFIGDLDEIALYGRALSVDEINAIYGEHAANASGRAELQPARNFQTPMRSGLSGFYPNN